MTSTLPTMADVARHARLSVKTVSRVVNNEPYVSGPVRQRVRDSIAALGYQRNELAWLLRFGTGHKEGPLLGWLVSWTTADGEDRQFTTRAHDILDATRNALHSIGTLDNASTGTITAITLKKGQSS